MGLPDPAGASTPAAIPTGPPRPAPTDLPTLSLAVHPAVLRPGRRARAHLSVINAAQEPVRVWPVVADPTGRTRARFEPASVLLEPAEHKRVALRLRRRGLRRPRGGTVLTVGAVIGEPGGAAPDPDALDTLLPFASEQHVMRVTEGGRIVRSAARTHAALPRITVAGGPRVPFAIVLAALVLAGLAVLGARLLDLRDRVEVPAVVGETDAFTAALALERQGLRADPRIAVREVGTVPAGQVIDQRPPPGERLAPGEPVTLAVAVGTGRTGVPDLEGVTVEEAEAALRDRDLSVGLLHPRDPAGAAEVALQIPAAFQSVPPGTPVTLFLGPATPPAESSGRSAEVPVTAGESVAAAARAVAAAGLVPKIIRRVDEADPGTLLGTAPVAGEALAPGATVRLLVSGGIPLLAFDTGSVVRLLDPVRGRTVREAAPPEADAVEPSWTAAGAQLVYRVGRRLLLAPAQLGEGGRVLYEGRRQYVLPTFSPSRAHATIAMIRRGDDGGDLCFATVGAGRIEPRCARDGGWDLGRQISWRKDGREILVFGVRRGNKRRFGILRFRTDRPFTADPGAWRASVATSLRRPGRGAIAAAFSPSGQKVALVSNTNTPRFQLTIADAGKLARPKAEPLPVRACEVSWRPDGDEVAVVQSDDGCQTALGDLVRVDVRRPREAVTVATGARHPAYQAPVYTGPGLER